MDELERSNARLAESSAEERAERRQAEGRAEAAEAEVERCKAEAKAAAAGQVSAAAVASSRLDETSRKELEGLRAKAREQEEAIDSLRETVRSECEERLALLEALNVAREHMGLRPVSFADV